MDKRKTRNSPIVLLPAISDNPLERAVRGGQLKRRGPPAAAIPAIALGALAIGALAIGALAIGSLAIGRLAIGRVRLRHVEIDDLTVRRLRAPERDPKNP